MRVLQLIKTSIGMKWTVHQTRELVKLGVEVHVALPEDGPRVPEYRAAGVHVHFMQTDFPFRQPWRFPHLCKDFRNLVDRIQPALIHSHFVGPTLTMRLALGKSHPVPRLFQVPGPLHLEHPLLRQTELATAGKPDYWIGSCAWTCQCYRQSGVAANRLFLSYYGTNLDLFKHAARGKLRQELNLNSQLKLVGIVAFMYAPKRFLGQTRGLKGHEDLIDALAICQKIDPDIRGVFVGGAWNNATAYERQVQMYGRKQCGDSIVFLGTRHDVPDLYPDLDVVVHPSHSENVGGAVESLLAGVPTIATNVGGFPDLIHHGETGWLVPPRDPAQLAQTILNVLHAPEYARQIGLQGQAYARKLFDVRATAQDIVQIYSTVLSDVAVPAISIK